MIGILFHTFYIPFAIGLNFEIEGSYIAIDVICIFIMILDSILRPYLAI